jgi:hypothetical protein
MTMGLTTGDFPPVDPATFMETPYRERLKTLSRHWVEYGFGAPKITMLIYIAKLVFLYALGGILIATLTSHLNPLHPSAWFYAPIVYQKMVLWTVLLECLGVAGSWGPLAAHFKPMTGGWHYWGRPGTVRVAPWPARVPFTGGDSRTWLDVVLYVALLASPAPTASWSRPPRSSRSSPCSCSSASATRSSSSRLGASSTCR